MSEDLEYTKKLLEIEYAQVRARINAVDEIRFKLKGWAITFSTGLLALGISRGQRWIMLLSLPIAVLLCLIEADYLLRQDALRRRSDDLEEVMESVTSATMLEPIAGGCVAAGGQRRASVRRTRSSSTAGQVGGLSAW